MIPICPPSREKAESRCLLSVELLFIAVIANAGMDIPMAITVATRAIFLTVLSAEPSERRRLYLCLTAVEMFSIVKGVDEIESLPCSRDEPSVCVWRRAVAVAICIAGEKIEDITQYLI
jgi:hypothetical protein